MPRPRDVVNGSMTYEERHTHAIEKAIKLNEPYAVVKHKDLSLEGKFFAVIYRAPRGGGRHIVRKEIKSKVAASTLRDRLSRAWAEGFWSALQGGFDP